ncbi:hypothetical protein VBQ74_13790, partial [Klebsiella pneumoniae]|nr:hypothetical protein [Klebsiella pneumoniae]
MAELNPPLGTTTPEIFLDNVKRADELVNGPAGTVNDRAGEPLDTWRQMMVKNDEVRQNIIPLSKQYQTLEAAQADIANIPVGSTTYYRSPDDSALAVEVMNVSGTLQPTGRRMPSYDLVAAISQAVTAEVMARTGLIFSSDDQTMLSLCDEWGYEAGRITENSFETRKLRLIQSETGPLLTLVDDFGYAVNLFSERGALVAGNNELSDSESLISFPDEFGNELILVDKQGRLYAGDNIIFDAPDWARCTVDPFG